MSEKDKSAWKLVPVEPTDQMTFIGQKFRYTPEYSIGAIYRAMLAAAPEPPASADFEQRVRSCLTE